MKRFVRKGIALLIAISMSHFSFASNLENEVSVALKSLQPGYGNIGNIKVESVKINRAKKEITVRCNETVGYNSIDSTMLSGMKDAVKASIKGTYDDYKVKIYAGKHNIDDYLTVNYDEINGPTEEKRFVTPVGGVKAPKGLDGRNIAMWQSHGWYFEPKLNRWEWQRARIFETVEDLYTQSYVLPFLMPMLENAGAYVMSPRERDINANEVIVDRDGGFAQSSYVETIGTQSWTDADVKGFAYKKAVLENGDNPFVDGGVRAVSTVKPGDKVSTATWTPTLPKSGKYAVYVSYASLPNSASDATYRIHSRSGVKEFKVNQQMGGGTWIYLGHFNFDANGDGAPVIELINTSSDENAVVTADAVKFGGGMGNVARKVKEGGEPGINYEYVKSEYPRFTEAARYWMQWAGVPDSIYTPSDNVNDYTDDYKARGAWVNYLTGGSSMLPNHKGLNIPIDLSLAFHTDAGTTMNDSIIGTLSIYYSENGGNYANGTPRYASRMLTDSIATNIVGDIRANYEPRWTRRAMWDKTYYEARVPQVPALLLELLSHQNFADMKYGLDPSFRFTVSRAIYKGMLQFIANRDNRPYVVQPLPIKAFAINKKDDGAYLLSWQATEDKQEATAMPSFYIVEERIGDGEFREIAKVDKNEYIANVNDDKIHSYRIIAGNEGGVSFPSEVLALCDKGKDAKSVTIVNGFTRVSAPDWFEAGAIAGFNDRKDHGVPYVYDISYIGEQTEFRRNIPWMDDDAAGFGASRANYETKVIAGNTFDFVYCHGVSIADAGYSFVSSSAEAFAGANDKPKIVDLILGKQKEIKVGTGAYGTKYKTFPDALQNRIRSLAKEGTDIFVSGAYVATDLWDNSLSDKATLDADKKFAAEVLGYKWRTGQASIIGEAYHVQSRFSEFNNGKYKFNNELNDTCYVVESPDSFYPADDKKGATIIRYTENNLIGGVACDNGMYQTVVIGFPFETITDQSQRNHLMKATLDFFKNHESGVVKVKSNKQSKKK